MKRIRLVGLVLSVQTRRLLDIVAHWLASYSCTPEQISEARADALRWALQRGSRSGRVAWQFARDYAGRNN